MIDYNTFVRLSTSDRLKRFTDIARRTEMLDFPPLSVSQVSRILRGICGYSIHTGAMSLRRIAAAALVEENWLIDYVTQKAKERQNEKI